MQATRHNELFLHACTGFSLYDTRRRGNAAGDTRRALVKRKLTSTFSLRYRDGWRLVLSRPFYAPPAIPERYDKYCQLIFIRGSLLQAALIYGRLCWPDEFPGFMVIAFSY